MDDKDVISNNITDFWGKEFLFYPFRMKKDENQTKNTCLYQS